MLGTGISLKLYTKNLCHYCTVVEKRARELGFSLQKINTDEEGKRAELIAEGGKAMVPFLVDTKRGVKLYESADIIAYLEELHKNGENSFA